MKRSRIILIASTAVLAIGSIFGAKAMHKKTALTVYYKINGGTCTGPVNCTTVGTAPCISGTPIVYYTSAGGCVNVQSGPVKHT